MCSAVAWGKLATWASALSRLFDPGTGSCRSTPSTPGNSRLTVTASGVFTYPWQTLEEWAGTCREVVVTRDDGKQHRAFFRFL
jgi:hypothetical protein